MQMHSEDELQALALHKRQKKNVIELIFNVQFSVVYVTSSKG